MELYVESGQGHDTIKVGDKPEEVQKAVEKELKDDKWVTTEKKDGSTEILTKKDIPKEEELDDEDKALMKEAKGGDWQKAFKKDKSSKPAPAAKTATQTREEWTSKFKDVKSATASHKAKGG